MITIMSALPEPALLAALGAPLLASARRWQPAAGTVLFRTGDRPRALHFVAAGEALMQRVAADGAPVILQRATQAFLADASLTSARYHCDGVCRSACQLVSFEVAALRAAIDASAQTRWAWIGLLSAQLRRQRARIERMALKTVRARLAHLLLTEGDAAGCYALPGTRLALAAELGVTPEALYRALARLGRDGVIGFDGRRLCWRG
jgi:CRP/FNR family transcriptional regulator, dissimilatory nitrate respiration regulator